MVVIKNKLLAAQSLSVIELGAIVFLWQASTGVFLISLVQQYLPQELHAGASFSGFALAAYAAARFALQAPAGWLADRLGRRRTLTLGIAVSLPSIYLMFQVQDSTSFLAFSALYGAGSAAVWPSIMAHIGDTHGPERRGSTLNVLNISQLLGLGVGTMAGVTLVDLISYQASFIACMLFSGLALAFAYRGARDESQRTTASKEKHERSLRSLLTSRVILLAGIALLLSIGTTVQAPVVAEYSSEVLETKMYMLGLMLIGPAAVAGFLAFKYGHLSDRFGRQLPLIGGLAVATVCYFALSQTTNPILAVHLIVLAGLAYAVSIPAWGAAALDASEIGGRGLLMGLFATVQGFGGVLGQVVGGLSSEMWGPVAPFKMGGLLLMLALFLTVAHLYHSRRTAVIETAPA